MNLRLLSSEQKVYIWWDHPRVASLKMVSNVHGRDACANIHRTIEHFNTT